MSTTAASIAPKLLELKSKDFTFGQRLCVGMPRGRTNNFPWKWAWLRSHNPTILA